MSHQEVLTQYGTRAAKFPLGSVGRRLEDQRNLSRALLKQRPSQGFEETRDSRNSLLFSGHVPLKSVSTREPETFSRLVSTMLVKRLDGDRRLESVREASWKYASEENVQRMVKHLASFPEGLYALEKGPSFLAEKMASSFIQQSEAGQKQRFSTRRLAREIGQTPPQRNRHGLDMPVRPVAFTGKGGNIRQEQDDVSERAFHDTAKQLNAFIHQRASDRILFERIINPPIDSKAVPYRRLRTSSVEQKPRPLNRPVEPINPFSFKTEYGVPPVYVQGPGFPSAQRFGLSR